MIGRTLSTYRIVERLGAGGMGAVYRARDEKLDRDVAVKVLPPGLLGDETAHSRFRKEAKALSRLSHPHVATLHDFGNADGVDYLVMELVPGPTLDLALREGPLAARDVVRLGTQLARGLAAAHERGIVHRDLKPSNLGLTADGLLKILDFGLARLVAAPSAEATQETPTETAAGKVVGSPPYMSPEQLVGKGADARSDVYSAGACLYELATGRRPYGEKSGALLVDAILHEAPEPAGRVRAGLPPGLESVIAKAMDKEPGLRYQTAKELLVDLERMQQGTPSVRSSTATGHRWAWSWGWAAAVIAAAVLFAWRTVPGPAPRITAVRPLVSDLGRMGTLDVEGTSWATDGERVYYVAPKLEGGANAGSALYHVAVAGGDPVELPLPFPHGLAVLGHVPAESALLVRGQTEPLSSRSDVDVGLPLWLVPVPFGPPRRVPNLLAWDAAVAPDGRTLAVLRWDRPGAETRPRLLLAGIDGTALRDLGVLPVLGADRLCWSPDGRRLRFTSGGLGSDGWESQVWEIAAEGGPPRALWPGAGGAWTADGRYFLFERAVREAPRRDVFVERESRWPPWGRVGPEPLTVGPLSFWLARPGRDPRRLFAFGRTGRGELMRFDPDTRTFSPALGGESALYAEPSPDGQWLAWVRYPEGTLWKGRPDGSGRQRLTSAPLEVHLPRWSPDGRRLTFAGRSPSEPQLAIHVIEADGSRSNVVARPARGEDHYWDACWLPDETIVFGQPFQNNPGGLLHVDPRTGAAKAMPGGEGLRWPKCSRQGDLLATFIDASGQHSRVRRRGQASWEDLGVISLMYPNWTRDGRSFCGSHFPSLRIECFSLDSRRLSALGPKPPFQLLGWVGAAWMGLDAEDRPLVAADRSTIGLYALEREVP